MRADTRPFTSLERFPVSIMMRVFMIPLIALFHGCVTPSDMGAPPSVSLEEAKEITAEFEGRDFTPPPRTVHDIEDLLAEVSVEDQEAFRSDQRMADQKPPENARNKALASFYLKRANACSNIGRAWQEARDYEKATEYGTRCRLETLQTIKYQWGLAEWKNGIFSKGLAIVREAIAEQASPAGKCVKGSMLARAYALSGNIPLAMEALDQARRNRDKTRHWKKLSTMYRIRMDAFVQLATGDVLNATGKRIEAERHYREAIQAFVPFQNTHLTAVASKSNAMVLNLMMSSLAANLLSQRRLVEAEYYARKALTGSLKSHGRLAPHTGKLGIVLAGILLAQGRHDEAACIVKIFLEQFERVHLSKGSLYYSGAQALLADSFLLQERWDQAMAEYDGIRRHMATDPALFDQFIGAKPNYFLALIQGGRKAEALPLIQAALDQKTDLLGEAHYETAETRGVLGIALFGLGRREEAFDALSQAIPLLIQQANQAEQAGEAISVRDFRLALILDTYIHLLSKIRGTPLETRKGIDAASEAFRLADLARGPSTRRAISAASARAAANDPELFDLARREQDTQMQISALNGLLSSVLSSSDSQKDPAAIQDLRSRINRLRGARITLMKEIEGDFPDYADLVNPKSMEMKEVRSILRPGEALIATYVGERGSYVWAIPHEGPAAFTSTGLNEKDIARMVRKIRGALDPRAGITLGQLPAFDLKTGYRLYASLLKPVASGWKGAKRLFVVAHGALGYLPFSALPTGEAALGPETEPLFSNYRSVPWLARSHAVTVLPSAASLRTLRSAQAGGPGREPFKGFGDPCFHTAQAEAQTTQVASAAMTRGAPLKRRGLKKICVGEAAPDSAGIETLPPLPDTATEVRGIASALGADEKCDVFLGKAASEDQVKSMDLSSVQVLAFATHGLLPGELNGLRQPALALSCPEVTRGEEDGLLTMGEILGLRLNADWVVLSACNTGAGEGAGAEAVSGLGRAFFYAGTKALLVSQWAVETTSAKELTTGLFRRQAEYLNLGRSEALNRTMLDLIDRKGLINPTGEMVFSYAHPIFWAPFVVVGEGGV